jgi:hypothetical protein
MFHWLVVLTLALPSATAYAGSEQPSQVSGASGSGASAPGASASGAALRAATNSAAAAISAAERDVAQLTSHSAALEKRYTDELDAIDRLKRQRPSWRRDREIRDSLSSSLDTSNQLDTATASLKRARSKLQGARRAYLAAIDAELGAGPSPVRLEQLQRARTLLSWQLKDARAPRHIMIPDLDVDPLADPEELDQRAAELRESERLLSRQLAALDAQATGLQRSAQLHKHNDRAVDLVTRYEDSPHRRTTRGTDPTPEAQVPLPPTRLPSLERDPSDRDGAEAGRLENVIETSADTVPGMRSGTPAQRAEAARKAYDEMARRLEKVRSRRLEIEARAHQLRAGR